MGQKGDRHRAVSDSSFTTKSTPSLVASKAHKACKGNVVPADEPLMGFSKLLNQTNLKRKIDNRSITMVETIKGGDGLLTFGSASSAGLDSRAFARWAATGGVDSEISFTCVPANPQPTRLQVLNLKLQGHLLLGGTNVHIS